MTTLTVDVDLDARDPWSPATPPREAALDRLLAIPPHSPVLAMVGMGTLHRPMLQGAVRTLKLWRDAQRLNLWVVLFDHVLRGIARLDRPAEDLSDLPEVRALSAPFMRESVTDCLRGALTRATHAMLERPVHVVAMSSQLGMIGVPLVLNAEGLDLRFTALPVGHRDRSIDGQPAAAVPMVSRDVLHLACEQRLLRDALAQTGSTGRRPTDGPDEALIWPDDAGQGPMPGRRRRL